MNTIKRIAAVSALALFTLLTPACDAGKPSLPVKVMQRNALLAGGKVAAFTNTGNKTLSVLSSPPARRRRSEALKVGLWFPVRLSDLRATVTPARLTHLPTEFDFI